MTKRERLQRAWQRFKCGCATSHKGDRLRVHRDGQVFYQCSQCLLEVHHVLPGQEPKMVKVLLSKEAEEAKTKMDHKILRIRGIG